MKNRKKDIIVVATIVGLALLLFGINKIIYRQDGETYGEIFVAGKLVETVDLTKDQQLSVSAVPAILLAVKDGRIAFIKSDCPDKTCIESGYLGEVGQNTTCLPNKTTIRIRSREPNIDEPDIVATAH
jgi:hypothetical protein